MPWKIYWMKKQPKENGKTGQELGFNQFGLKTLLLKNDPQSFCTY